MNGKTLDYRFTRLIAISHIGILLDHDTDLSDEQVDDLIEWGEATFEEIGDNEAIAKKLREVAQTLYEELAEDFTEEEK